MSILWQKAQCMFYRVFGRDHKCECGHSTKWKTLLTVDGKEGIYSVGKKRDYCPQCWKKAAIQCAWCSRIITPGDAVTLYTPKDKDFKIPEHAVVYKRTPHLQLVGCMGWECAESGMDRSGFWVMPGKVERVVSPFEMIMGKMGNPNSQVMVVQDLSNPNEAVYIPDDIAKPGE